MNAPENTIDLDFLSRLSVLYVEDEDEAREALARYLRRRCPKLEVAANGQEGLERFRVGRHDVVVTDVRMPVMDGLDMAKTIKAIHEEVPVIIVTAYNEADYFMRAIDVGVDSYVKKPIDPEELIRAIYKSTVVRFRLREIERKRQRALDTVQQALVALGRAIERRNPFTDGHQRRVSRLAEAIAREMGLADDVVGGIRLGASVHDVGNIKISAEVLAAPRRLDAEEMAVIRTHPQGGFEILGGIDFPWPVAETVLQHHERLDGSGYPRGLAGDAILLEARIVAVADVIEAMCADRPHRPAPGMEAALAEVRSGKGRLYDADVVDACLRVIERGTGFWSD